MATFYLDPEGGNDANDGTTFANRWKTVTSGATAARIAPGDIIRLMASPDPSSLGMTAAWTDKSKTVTLNAALTKNADLGETAWTASANVTAATSTTRKEGANSSSLTIAAAFTTGKVAYIAIAGGGTQDFSAYKQLSFWIRSTTTLGAGVLELRLCSDTIGDTAVDTFAIPAINTTTAWFSMTVNKGSALGASIQSLALWAASDPGAPIVIIDNVIACKDVTGADALSLTSMIGKNVAGETWWPIQSINGVTVLLDAGMDGLATVGRGYSGTTETVTTYRREPVIRDEATQEDIKDSGTAGNMITFSGGWNRTDMTTQTGETWWRTVRGQHGITISGAVKSFVRFEKLGLIARLDGLNFNVSHDIELDTIACISCGSDGLSVVSTYRLSFIGSCFFCCAQARGINGFVLATGLNYWITQPSGTIKCFSNLGFGVSALGDVRLLSLTCNNNGDSGILWSNGVGVIATMVAKDNATYGVEVSDSSRVFLLDLTTSGNTLAAVFLGTAGNVNSRKAVHSEGTIASFDTTYMSSRYQAERFNNTVDDHRIYTTFGNILSETGANRHTASGIAWKLSPTFADTDANAPLILPLSRIAVNANALVTVKAWMKRSNTALTGKLVCRNAQLDGITSEVSASVSAAADTYQELTITFTPTEKGVVEIEAHAFGGTTHSLYVDDMTLSQA